MISTGSGPRTLVAGATAGYADCPRARAASPAFFPRRSMPAYVLDVSKISRTVPDTVAHCLEDIERFAPEVALLAIGGADSLVFPVQWFQRIVDRFAPPEWVGVEGLMPPAMLPRDRKKRLRKRLEIFAKTLIKQLMINLFGARRRVPLDEVERASEALLSTLDRVDATVVVVGCTDVDDLTFPKSRKNIRATNAMLSRLVVRHANAMYVDPRPMVDKWAD